MLLPGRLRGGCATAFTAHVPGPPDEYEALVACIVRALDNVHFECADSLACATTGYSSLP